MSAFTNWLRQGSTATGITALLGTVTHTAATGVTTDPLITALGLGASLLLMLWPEKSVAIKDVQQIVTDLVPTVEQIAPLISQAIADAKTKPVVVVVPPASTVSGAFSTVPVQG